MATVDRAQRIADSEAETYSGLALQAPEQALLRRFRGRWHEMSMLDLGVGAGRTAYTFAPLVRRYLGVDYAPRAIELARERMAEGPDHRLVVGDARRLTELVQERFDLVLFSFNGIDYMDHEDRLVVLGQVRSLLAAGGCFVFSSHSAAALPLEEPGVRVEPRRPLRSVYRAFSALRLRRGIRRVNAGLDLEEARRRGWVPVNDAAHGFGLQSLYVHCDHQVRELEGAGFGGVELYDLSGRRADPAAPGADPWLYYVCRGV